MREGERGGALTFWRLKREGKVRTVKESERDICTHILESSDGGTSHDTNRR
jgi:hypothetical protein